MSGFKVKQWDHGGQARKTTREDLIPDAGEISQQQTVIDLDHVLKANEELNSDPERLWCIKLIFAHRIDADGEPMQGKEQVGVFLLRPTGISASDAESVLVLSDGAEMARKMDELKKQVSNLYRKEIFTIGHPAPKGAYRIEPDRLFQLVCKVWSSHPVNTMGYVEMWYQHIRSVLKRNDMAQESGRQFFYSEIQNVLTLMKRGFFFDHSTGGLRRQKWGLKNA